MKKHHILVALVENKSGVLNRIASLFRRRRFNIESLTVGACELPGLSRMTIVVDAELTNIEQVLKQMNKLINIIEVQDITNNCALIQELALIKIGITAKNKEEVLKIIKKLHGKAVSQTPKSITVELVGEPQKINFFLDTVGVFGVKELCRTGATAISCDS